MGTTRHQSVVVKHNKSNERFDVKLKQAQFVNFAVIVAFGIVAQVLNEVVVDRGPSSYLTNLEIYCNDHHITSVQGDGKIQVLSFYSPDRVIFPEVWDQYGIFNVIYLFFPCCWCGRHGGLMVSALDSG